MKIDDEACFAQLMCRPTWAWPTLTLFVAIVCTALLATAGAVSQQLPYLPAIVANTLCSYAAYTVLHEAAHGLVTRHRAVNNWVGRIAMFMVSVTPFFRTYRFLHITHHRFANDPQRDPDISCGGGRWWTLPMRWAVMDVAYVCTYLRRENYTRRPPAELREFWIATGFGVWLLTTVTVMGWWPQFALLYILPTRVAILVLAAVFDFLPHHPQDHTAQQDGFHATSNRVGLEWLLTPLLIGQNYHLAHHIYPGAPFYRYQRIWAARRSYHESMGGDRTAFYRLKPDRLQ